jgi:hypothetical protein
MRGDTVNPSRSRLSRRTKFTRPDGLPVDIVAEKLVPAGQSNDLKPLTVKFIAGVIDSVMSGER